ncbi:MAG: class I SAM-dependent methyltransferase [Caldilineaceae bacterium]|nr:class I SAM-dependent methyltransferase [Caldilineaceae bacterium]
MNLLDLIHRQSIPEPWAEGEKIPWNDPAFSRRMLREHLSQEHDHASRRSERIERHVAWMHGTLLGAKGASILDLGCGPGLYATRLARLGHPVTGIDFSPASIDYAQKQATEENLPCRFVHGDIRRVEYGSGYGLAMLIFGEFNVFHPDDARAILRKIHAALDDGGLLLLEPHTVDVVKRSGESPPSWYTSKSGLFSEAPHLVLTENFWFEDRQIATERYFIINGQSGEITRHAANMQAYSDDQLTFLLVECGFTDLCFYPSLHGDIDAAQADFFALTARKR